MSASPLVAPGDVDGMLRWLNDRVSVLEQTAIIPVGLIAYCPGAVPNGWLLCDGSSISNTRYGQLAAYLGTTVLPDMDGRVVVGKAAAATFAALLSVGGVETVTLTGPQSGQPGFSGTTGNDSPDHVHEEFINGPGVSPTTTGGAGGYAWGDTGPRSTGGASARHQHTFSIGSASAAQAHTNLQPYIVLNPIIKV